jgi:transcriptional regulator with XRE-family HTH domain
MLYASVNTAQELPPDGGHNARVYKVAVDSRQLILELAERQGLRTPAELARKSGIPQPTLSRYLNGKHATLTAQHWMALAHALSVTVSELLGETPLATKAVREINTILAGMPEEARAKAARLLRALSDPAS